MADSIMERVLENKDDDAKSSKKTDTLTVSSYPKKKEIRKEEKISEKKNEFDLFISKCINDLDTMGLPSEFEILLDGFSDEKNLNEYEQLWLTRVEEYEKEMKDKVLSSYGMIIKKLDPNISRLVFNPSGKYVLDLDQKITTDWESLFFELSIKNGRNGRISGRFYPRVDGDSIWNRIVQKGRGRDSIIELFILPFCTSRLRNQIENYHSHDYIPYIYVIDNGKLIHNKKRKLDWYFHRIFSPELNKLTVKKRLNEKISANIEFDVKSISRIIQVSKKEALNYLHQLEKNGTIKSFDNGRTYAFISK